MSGFIGLLATKIASALWEAKQAKTRDEAIRALYRIENISLIEEDGDADRVLLRVPIRNAEGEPVYLLLGVLGDSGLRIVIDDIGVDQDDPFDVVAGLVEALAPMFDSAIRRIVAADDPLRAVEDAFDYVASFFAYGYIVVYVDWGVDNMRLQLGYADKDGFHIDIRPIFVKTPGE
ncbi:MAG: hypothetical protein DRO09_00410 [Thermoprotei archaeon]|nr:MAG: hypothetical protein DRO09_00410 [Thermoprotei archaeon]